MTQKKINIQVGDQIKVVKVLDPSEIIEDIQDMKGIVHWITTGFDGQQTIFEVELENGKIFALYAKEIEKVDNE